MAKKDTVVPFHPYALDVMTEAVGVKSAYANLAFVIECARSDEPEMQRRINEFLERAGD